VAHGFGRSEATGGRDCIDAVRRFFKAPARRLDARQSKVGGGIVGLVVAILIIAVGINGFELLGAPFWVESLFQGTALVGAVALSQVRRRSGAPR